MDARFIKGNYQTMDHTPESAVSAGDVVIVGDLVGIAHEDIAASTKGTLAIAGGTYLMLKPAGSGTAITVGAKTYWDTSPEGATATSSGNKATGFCVAAASDDDTTVRVFHHPF